MRKYSRKNRKPTKTRTEIRASNRALVNAFKLERGECALHSIYNNGERKYVIAGLEYLFDMDHLDRNKKTKNIAKMMGDASKSKQIGSRTTAVIAALVAEMAKCQVVCVECHRRKTVENKEWINLTKHLQPQVEVIHKQLSLFDDL